MIMWLVLNFFCIVAKRYILGFYKKRFVKVLAKNSLKCEGRIKIVQILEKGKRINVDPSFLIVGEESKS